MDGEKLITNIPLPMCVIDENGKIKEASTRIGEVFLYDKIVGSDVFALMGIKCEQLWEAADTGEEILFENNKKHFKLLSSYVEDSGEEELQLYFLDITETEALRERCRKIQDCFMIVSVDNYDELINSTDQDNEATLMSNIDKAIRSWAATYSGSVTKFKDHEFMIVVRRPAYDEMVRKKFDILEKIKKVETEADFPVTVSIGVGMGGASPEENDDFSQDALDIAYGRGGAQVVVKDGNNLTYFGGKTETVEKGNKGKSRIIGYALMRLMNTSSRIFIMGHRNPDLDSFGAALGVYRMAKALNKEAYIIINGYSDAIDVAFREAKDSGEYEFINNQKVDYLMKSRALCVVVDTHRPSITEYPELVTMTENTVVIDHHRKSEENVEKSTLEYMEPYASSASELVTEILQYTLGKRVLSKLEAKVLMAGIWVDTNRFSTKAGVRTFEAAAWLRRAGADISDVKKFFQTNVGVFQKRANAVANAEYSGEIAFSVCKESDPNIQIINSMVADELLTVRGMRASFVAGKNAEGRTAVSARSVGGLNVQVVMEQLGGGGHMNTAGTQLDEEPAVAIEMIKEILENMKDESNSDEKRER